MQQKGPPLCLLPFDLLILVRFCQSVGVEAVLRVLSGSEQDAVAPTVHWLEFAVAQLVHVRPSLQPSLQCGCVGLHACGCDTLKDRWVDGQTDGSSVWLS
eukprot:1159058-Pelagomonas_calceolata.AAC.9